MARKKRIRTKKLSTWLLIAVMGLITFNLLTTAPPHTPQTTNPIRGIWLTHVGNSLLSYTGRTDNVFHQLSRLNFNRVYVDVYNGGTIYPSKYVPKNNRITLPFTDPLKAAIKEGKRQGLKIYAWYEHGMMLHLNSKFAEKHPDWLLETSTKEKAIDRHLWLNPEHPEVQQYFLNMFTEVAQNYPDLYGIQLDDHWGIPIQFGDKAKAMTELTRKVTAAIKQVNPDLIISLSPNPISFSSHKYAQNWLSWIRQKLVDEIIVQVYRQTSQEVAQTIPNSGLEKASRYVPVAVGIYAGDFDRPKSLQKIKQQIEVVKKFGYGYCLFCWEYAFSPLRKLFLNTTFNG